MLEPTVQYLGLWVLIAMSLNMWALLSVLQSGARITSKLIWAIVLLALPGLAFLVWCIFGPRRAG